MKILYKVQILLFIDVVLCDCQQRLVKKRNSCVDEKKLFDVYSVSQPFSTRGPDSTSQKHAADLLGSDLSHALLSFDLD